MPSAYLDYAATAPVRREARRAMQPFMEEAFGNPSSAHGLGMAAQDAIEAARGAVSELMGCEAHEIFFTAGGTESINLALQGIAMERQQPGHLIISAVEHPAALETARFLRRLGWKVTYIPVDSHGIVNLEALRDAMTPDTPVVSLMHVNNEVGAIQPLEQAAAIVRESGAILHVDAVQSAGKLPLRVHEMGIDLLSISAHKLGGPKGVGALFVRSGLALSPLIHGGGQERGLRSGTENVAGIVGLGAAALAAAREMTSEAARIGGLRDRLADGILYSADAVRPTGHPTERLPSFCHLTIEGVDGHWLVKELSRMGIFASTGSACSSGETAPSHVLTAMGIPEVAARGALRLTLGWATTPDEIRYAIQIIPQAVERLRARGEAGADLAAEYARDCHTARDQAIGGLLGGALSKLTRRRGQ